ncbi:protein phosphatase methylesterase 1 isoform X1 [Bombyx mori]|uniref:Protein phosphatase methylesterase 1 n=1 Tax=Bombyx mori TaxID=7091 RepID=A0A8R2QWZ4_BOMMO|nr:protein phosphatase methylesterase 1 isoform X1 [Bombyx mori]
MSTLQKTIMKNKLPPRCPKTSGVSKLAPFGAGRRKDYTPVSWKQYFERFVDVETDGGTFRVYLSPEPDHPQRPRFVTLHGGGYSGLSWALFTEEITNMVHCQVVSIDLRGHGETKANDSDDLSAETLVKDVEQVLHKLYGDSLPPIILVGHSMGGAIAVRTALLPTLEPFVQGIAVIDVVEGIPPNCTGAAWWSMLHSSGYEERQLPESTAMDALASMQSFLRGRPTHFKSIEHAIEWCVRSGQVRNVDSAKVSMPGQIVNCDTGLLATNEVESYQPVEDLGEAGSRHDAPHHDSILEEEGAEGEGMQHHFAKPAVTGDRGMKYRWRIALAGTERHWAGWFRGLSAAFLAARAPRLLLLASVDGLDRELTVGQMQGKFQMQVLTRCGHAVHEDTPGEVARVIAAFVLRHHITTATDNGELMNIASGPPGC